MAEMGLGGRDQFVEPGGMGTTALSWIGTLVSVTLIAGLVYWGAQLTLRDVRDIPVIQALEEPSRVRPEEPGGQLAEHQGLSVNNVQANGEAEGPAPQIILAPSAVVLTDDDKVVAQPNAQEISTIAENTAVEATQESQLDGNDPVVAALLAAERAAESAEPLSPLQPNVIGASENAAVIEGVVLASIRPTERPASANPSTSADAASTSNVGLEAVDIDPATVAKGTRLVQLGAFDSVEVARAEWDKITAKFSTFMDGKKRYIQEAQSGNRTFYRLRAVGFDTLDVSRRFCAVLVAENAACIPVLAR